MGTVERNMESTGVCIWLGGPDCRARDKIFGMRLQSCCFVSFIGITLQQQRCSLQTVQSSSPPRHRCISQLRVGEGKPCPSIFLTGLRRRLPRRRRLPET